MSCEQIEMLLVQYLCDELNEAERATVAAHIASCPACMEKLGDLRLTHNLVRDAVHAGPAPVLDVAHRAALAAAVAGQSVNSEMRSVSSSDGPFVKSLPAWLKKPARLSFRAAHTLRQGAKADWMKAAPGSFHISRKAALAAACVIITTGLVAVVVPELGGSRESTDRLAYTNAGGDTGRPVAPRSGMVMGIELRPEDARRGVILDRRAGPLARDIDADGRGQSHEVSKTPTQLALGNKPAAPFEDFGLPQSGGFGEQTPKVPWRTNVRGEAGSSATPWKGLASSNQESVSKSGGATGDLGWVGGVATGSASNPHFSAGTETFHIDRARNDGDATFSAGLPPALPPASPRIVTVTESGQQPTQMADAGQKGDWYYSYNQADHNVDQRTADGIHHDSNGGQQPGGKVIASWTNGTARLGTTPDSTVQSSRAAGLAARTKFGPEATLNGGELDGGDFGRNGAAVAVGGRGGSAGGAASGGGSAAGSGAGGDDLDKTIAVLQKRVEPTGVRNLARSDSQAGGAGGGGGGSGGDSKVRHGGVIVDLRYTGEPSEEAAGRKSAPAAAQPGDLTAEVLTQVTGGKPGPADNAPAVTKTYDVSDLLPTVPEVNNVRDFDLNGIVPGGGPVALGDRQNKLDAPVRATEDAALGGITTGLYRSKETAGQSAGSTLSPPQLAAGNGPSAFYGFPPPPGQAAGSALAQDRTVTNNGVFTYNGGTTNVAGVNTLSGSDTNVVIGINNSSVGSGTPTNPSYQSTVTRSMNVRTNFSTPTDVHLFSLTGPNSGTGTLNNNGSNSTPNGGPAVNGAGTLQLTDGKPLSGSGDSVVLDGNDAFRKGSFNNNQVPIANNAADGPTMRFNRGTEVQGQELAAIRQKIEVAAANSELAGKKEELTKGQVRFDEEAVSKLQDGNRASERPIVEAAGKLTLHGEDGWTSQLDVKDNKMILDEPGAPAEPGSFAPAAGAHTNGSLPGAAARLFNGGTSYSLGSTGVISNDVKPETTAAGKDAQLADGREKGFGGAQWDTVFGWGDAHVTYAPPGRIDDFERPVGDRVPISNGVRLHRAHSYGDTSVDAIQNWGAATAEGIKGTGTTSGPLFGEAADSNLDGLPSSITTPVIVPDRGTILSGGQRIASEQHEAGVPILGDFPGIGRVFTDKAAKQDASKTEEKYSDLLTNPAQWPGTDGPAHDDLVESLGGLVKTTVGTPDDSSNRAEARKEVTADQIAALRTQTAQLEAKVGTTSAELARRDAEAVRDRVREAVDTGKVIASMGQLDVGDVTASPSHDRSPAANAAKLQRYEEVQQLLRQAAEQRKELKNDRALELTNQALALDPNNAAAQAMKEMMSDSNVMAQFEKSRNENANLSARNLQDNERASKPDSDLVTYPSEWPAITAKRLGQVDANDAEADRVAALKLQQVIPIAFDANHLDNAIEFLRVTTGLNFDVHWADLQAAGITRETPITLKLTNVPVEQSLKLILQQVAPADKGNPVVFDIIDGVVTVAPANTLAAQSDTRVYDIRDIAVRLNGASNGSATALGAATQPANLDQVQALVKTTVGRPEDWSSGRLTLQEVNGNLIVRGSVHAQREVAGLLGQLRSKHAAPATQPAAKAAENAKENAPDTAPKFVAGPVNPWVLTQADRYSTFGLDVDTASYRIALDYLRRGYRPPPASVRMEEFVNSFDYNYPRQSKSTFNVHADAARSPFAPVGQNLTLLKVGVQGKVLGRQGRKPTNLVFVIDTSGSMARADRLPLVQEALATLVRQLGPGDKVSIVGFSTNASLVAQGEIGSDEQRQALMGALTSLRCQGSTNLGQGLKLGYATARNSFVSGATNRVILCSDGVANVGPNESAELLTTIESERRNGISMTCVGVGAESYNDPLLEGLADKGDGNYVFVDSPEEARRVFVEQMAALQPIAQDAKIQVEFDPAVVRRYRLIGYENRAIADKDFRNDTIVAGAVGSGQSSTALYELELNPGQPENPGEPAAAAARDLGTVFVRYRNIDTGKIEEISQPLPGSSDSHTADQIMVQQHPRFFLAACAAETAEILRQSEHAQGRNLEQVRGVLQEVCGQLPLDAKAKELLWMVERAAQLPEAPK